MTDPKFIDDACANCFAPLPDEVAGLFCSDVCKETAKLVRYWRAAIQDGRIDDSDVQYAIQIRIAQLLAGGYSEGQRRLPEAVRAAVWERDGGRCVICRAPGEEIDHISDASPRLENLQLLCRDCHRAKTATSLTPASNDHQQWVLALERERVRPQAALQLCDSDRWAAEWRRLTRERRGRGRRQGESTR